MKNSSRYRGGMLPGILMLILLLTAAVAQGATPQTAAGARHTIFLRADGTLWGAGTNLFGELGDGSFASSNQPVRIGGGSSWQAVAAGAEHSLALTADGTLWAWGRNEAGELGVVQQGGAPVANQGAPVQVGSDRDWVAVAASRGGSSYALKADGTLWAWGNNSSGQLGNGNTTQQNTPAQVVNASGVKYVAVAAGKSHALALQADGTLWAFGSNANGQLGDDSGLDRAVPVQVILPDAPSDNDWKTIAAGDGHSLALKADGTLWSWGDNSSGQLGIGALPSQPVPVQAGVGHDWAALSAGALHSLALKRDGSVWSFGDDRSGQLGNGKIDAQDRPAQIGAPTPLSSVVAIAAGAFHSFAQRGNGDGYAWGDNGSGQLGNGGSTGSLAPILVATAARGWLASEPGNLFTVALRSNGTLWSWGDNGSGQLGDGTLSQRGTPAMIGGADNWSAHSAGFSHVVALKGDGTLWSWGDNSSGQLGNGSLDPELLPRQVTGTAPSSADNDWSQVAAGDFHTLALKGDGSLWSWGDNSSGQLGDGGNQGQQRPQRVVTGNPGNFDNNWVAVAAGGSHSLALQADGTLWAWGDNAQGQLGDPSLNGSANTPQQIVNFTPPTPGYNSSWRALAAGYGHSLALQADGTLWAWGSNFSGQLGNGDATLPNPPASPAPVQVLNAGSAPFVAAAAGDEHSLARQADGSLWSWGSNTSGQLGIGASDPDPFHPLPHPTPLREALGGSDWGGCGSGGSHGIVLKAGGSLWAMGSNFSGQLGDGSGNDRNLPTPLREGVLKAAAPLSFRAAVGGGAVSLPFSVANDGNGTLFVTGVTLTGSDPGLFAVSAGSCSSADSFAVAAGGSCHLIVSFTPQASPGTKSATLLIESSDPLQPQGQTPLAGDSVQPVTIATSVTPAAGGTITPAGPLSVLPGASQLFTVSATTGYHLTDVAVNGVSQGAVGSLTVPVNGDTSVAATFALNRYAITLQSGPNGSMVGPSSALYNETPGYSITAAAGFHVVDVTVNGISKGAVASLTLPPVTSQVTIAASFAATTFPITATSDARGGITPAGSTEVQLGTSQSYTFTPAPGYSVIDVVVDGVSLGPLPSYTFSNVNGSHGIRAVFIPDGDLNGDATVDLADALAALRIAVNLDTASAGQRLHGDVAPLDGAGIPKPDGEITVADALVILRKSVGLSSGF